MTTASQFQPVSQNHTPVVPVAGQPWLPSGSQGVPVVTPMQPTGQQPSATAGSVPVRVPCKLFELNYLLYVIFFTFILNFGNVTSSKCLSIYIFKRISSY